VALSAPEPIGTNHQIGEFTSGVSLDEWQTARTCQSSKRRCAHVRRVRGGQGHWLLCLGLRFSNYCCSVGTLPAQYARADPCCCGRAARRRSRLSRSRPRPGTGARRTPRFRRLGGWERKLRNAREHMACREKTKAGRSSALISGPVYLGKPVGAPCCCRCAYWLSY
jgi:hypothetical protein